MRNQVVLCGTFSCLAISPAGRPTGSCRTRRRNASRRVCWDSAEKLSTAFKLSIFPSLWTPKGQVKARYAESDPPLSRLGPLPEKSSSKAFEISPKSVINLLPWPAFWVEPGHRVLLLERNTAHPFADPPA